MATENDRQEERDRMGNDPLKAPPAEELDEENPINSPAEPEPDAEEPGSHEERAATSMEPPTTGARSTEGLMIGGSEKTTSS